ncbi:MAG: type II secretion system F family protein [bacterium]|jgi:tight adherence protein B
MQLLLVLMFVVIFGLALLTMRAGQQYFAERHKKRLEAVLGRGDRADVRVETTILREDGEEKPPLLVQVLSRFNIVRKMERELQQSALGMSLQALLGQMLIAAIPGALIGWKLSVMGYTWFSTAGGAVLFALLPYARMRRARTKRLRTFEQQFPEALDFLARAMRAGHAFSISIEMLSDETPPPLGEEFRKVFNEHNLGLPIETALHNLTERVPLIDTKFFVSAVLLQRETGGNLAEILTKLAVVIRERFKVKGQVQAASAHGRITGTILTLMPVVLMMGLTVVSPSYLKGMAEDPDGRWLIFGAIVGIVLGHICIRKIIDIKV